jgi:hypothetical protein
MFRASMIRPAMSGANGTGVAPQPIGAYLSSKPLMAARTTR